MKRLLLVLLITTCCISVYSFPVDTVKINRSFAVMIESGYTAETQREFFDAFPKTWHEYWLTYGNIPAFNNLQSSFRSHMTEGLYKLDKIPDSLFYDRLISLGIAGTVEADDVGHDLQDLIQRELKKNPKLMVERLSKRMRLPTRRLSVSFPRCHAGKPAFTRERMSLSCSPFRSLIM